MGIKNYGKKIKRLGSKERHGPGTPTTVHHDTYSYRLSLEEYAVLKASGADLTRLGIMPDPSQMRLDPSPIEGYLVYSSTPKLGLEEMFSGFQTSTIDAKL